MASRLVDQLVIKLTNCKKLLRLPGSTAKLLNLLEQMETLLLRVQKLPHESIKNSIRPIIEEFIEVVVLMFKKLSSSSGVCYSKMIKVVVRIEVGKSEDSSVFPDHWISELESRLSRSSVNLPEFAILNAWKKLVHLPFSDAELLNILAQVKKVLSRLAQTPSESMKCAIDPIFYALLGKELVRHPDMDVNVSVTCCLCEIMRILAGQPRYRNLQKKECFELVVMTLEKLSAASGGCYYKTTQALKILRGARFLVSNLYLDVHYKVLVVRLFKHFFTVADSNSSEIVHEMEKIMTLIIQESDHKLVLMLVDLLVTAVRKDNQIVSPVCYRLVEKVINDCAVELEPCLRNTEIPPLPTEVPSLKSDLVSVEGYIVKNNIAVVLEAILKKHGDIAADCLFKTASARASFLEVVCEIAWRIQTSDFTTIMSEMEEIESQVSAVEATKINVSWLRSHLDAICKRMDFMKNSILLMETKGNTILVKRSAQMDLREKYAELVAAQERFEKAERCVRVFDLVEKKLNNNILEYSKVEKDLGAVQRLF